MNGLASMFLAGVISASVMGFCPTVDRASPSPKPAIVGATLPSWILEWAWGDEVGFPKSDRTELELNSEGVAILKAFRGSRLTSSSHWTVEVESMEKISQLVMESETALREPPPRYASDSSGYVPAASDCFNILSIDFYSGRKRISTTGDFGCATGLKASPYSDRIVQVVSNLVLKGHKVASRQ